MALSRKAFFSANSLVTPKKRFKVGLYGVVVLRRARKALQILYEPSYDVYEMVSILDLFACRSGGGNFLSEHTRTLLEP